MKRAAAWCVGLFLVAISLCACGNGMQFLFEVPVHLAAGWLVYPFLVLPRVTVDPAGVALFAVAVPLAAWLAHGMGRWLYEGDAAAGRRWRWRWTWLGLAGVLLMFAAGVAATGVVHQAGWLIRSPRPLTESSWTRIYCRRQLEGIGRALTMYARMNDGYRPADLADLARVAEIEDVPPSDFVCPADDARTPLSDTQPSDWASHIDDSHCSYVYCPTPVLGPDGNRRVSLYEPLYLHVSGLHVLYNDEKAEWVDADSASRWLATLEPTTHNSISR